MKHALHAANKKILVLLLALCQLTLLLCSCAGASSAGQRDSFLMDTLIQQRIGAAPNAEAVLDEAEALLRQLDNALSRFCPESDVSRISASAGAAPIPVGEDTLEVLRFAKEFSRQYSSALAVTIAPLSDLWNVNAEDPRVPDASAIQAALALVDDAQLILEGDTAFLARPGMSLDLGALGKGYACDRLIQLYRDKGVTAAIVSVGGSIAALGRPEGRAYTIGIRDPRGDASSYIATLPLEDAFCSTSGDYEQYFEAGGVRYHHIFDPATGYPADSGLMSVTVISNSGIASDALSTACFVLGPEEGIALLEAWGAEGVFVQKDGVVRVTPGLKETFALAEGTSYRLWEEGALP